MRYILKEDYQLHPQPLTIKIGTNVIVNIECEELPDGKVGSPINAVIYFLDNMQGEAPVIKTIKYESLYWFRNKYLGTLPASILAREGYFVEGDDYKLRPVKENK